MATANILTVYLVCLSYLLIAADSQRCKPQYSYSEEARGWLKLHMSPTPWNKALQTCLYEAYQLNKHTGSCYKVHDKKKVVWHEAYEVCAAEGAHLVIINNQEEALVIKNMIPAAYSGSTNKWDAFHIGLYRNSEELDWITLHGDRIDDVFNNWDPGQPDGGTPSHATIIRDGTLDDDNYTSLHRFVCERSPTVLQFEPLSGQYTEIEQTLNC
uniref:C-type lectin domain-containing protein n=1 Tax=Heliothis virescens TaxID=7102 RepID=A0A2A4JI18_HELVI